MRAVIIGAGNAGSNLAVKLCQENHDVVVVDRDQMALAKIEAQLDVLTIEGHGCNPRVLEEAELGKADLLVAVTSCDDVNILSCYQAAVAGVAYKVARIGDPDYLRQSPSFKLKDVGVDQAINPREECARDILNNLKLPGAHEVVRLLGERVLAVGLRVKGENPLIGSCLKSFSRQDLLQTIRFIAVLRNDQLIVPRGETTFEEDDDVYVVGPAPEISTFLDWVFPTLPHFEKVVIAGGGGVGIPLARLLEQCRIPADLIEEDETIANAVAGELDRTTVICGNPLSVNTLAECSLAQNVAFVGGTNSEENNIISCLLARKHGAGATIAQVTDPEYVPIINSISGLDRAVSTHLSTINAILHYIRGRRIESASVLHMLPGELLEIVLTSRSDWADCKISDLKIPKGAIVATVLRDDTVCSPTGDLVLLSGDRLVLFATPQAVKKLSAKFKK